MKKIFEDKNFSIEKIIVGPFSENCYLVNRKNSKECFLIDPGYESSKLLNKISSYGFELKYILVTHGHADHTGAIAKLNEKYDIQVFLGDGDQNLYENPDKWITDFFPEFESPPKQYSIISDDKKIKIDHLNIEVIVTPGHTLGSLCYKLENYIFTGDTLFKNSIGRYDLPGGDKDKELSSIKTKLLTLKQDCIVLPGHGDSTTIGSENNNNPYLI
jgi:glyoxylase-like metal-dependent hydrolase (beta-lactamase superfamily II)|tara:strand:- start:740 stop:1387 length:648 start_codon:yes stop_codon:yes gene_type:complete